jgi:hypothetical protein
VGIKFKEEKANYDHKQKFKISYPIGGGTEYSISEYFHNILK